MAGIYVHVPFCHSKCFYCDFYSVANVRNLRAFVDAVALEWTNRKAELGSETVTTIYFGGGTPSLLPVDCLKAIAELFPLDKVEEFTLEVNPEDVNAQTVRAWADAGVNRVSIGVQSLVDAELKAVGRRHSAQEALDAIKCLQDNGIGNVSGDLIYGLPGQTLETWMYSVNKLIGSDITHLSSYCLSFEQGTRLTTMLKRGLVQECDEGVLEQMYQCLCNSLRDSGFVHYEISNFAKPGFESRHNSSYWNLTPYLGLGPGAHSLDVNGQRRYVQSNLVQYVSDPAAQLVLDEETATDCINDLIFISLRTAKGLNLNLIPDEFRDVVIKSAAPHLKAGRLERQDEILYIPESQWLVSDSIIRDLIL